MVERWREVIPVLRQAQHWLPIGKALRSLASTWSVGPGQDAEESLLDNSLSFADGMGLKFAEPGSSPARVAFLALPTSDSPTTLKFRCRR